MEDEALCGIVRIVLGPRGGGPGAMADVEEITFPREVNDEASELGENEHRDEIHDADPRDRA